jgi:hypothetical protein
MRKNYVQKARLETSLDNARAFLKHGSTPDFVAMVLNLPLVTVEELAKNIE